MPKPPVRIRDAIRARLAEDYYRLHDKKSYAAVGSFWGVSGGVAHRIINDKKYFPTDRKIRKTLLKKAEQFNL